MIRRPPRSTLFLHDALPILHRHHEEEHRRENDGDAADPGEHATAEHLLEVERSEEHTSELQSQFHLVCRLLLEKKKKYNQRPNSKQRQVNGQTEHKCKNHY